MAPLHLIDKVSEGTTVEPQLAPELVGELTDILERSESTDSDRSYWYYSVPAAGARYYGFDQPAASERHSPRVNGD